MLSDDNLNLARVDSSSANRIITTNMLKPGKVTDAKKTKAKFQHKQHDLTPDQKQEIREAFDLFDSDGSG